MHTHEPALFRITFAGIEAASTVAEAIEVVQANYGIDYVTYHLAQTVAGIVDAPFVRTTYPDPWVARYLVKDYVKVDPILHEGLVRQLPFDDHGTAMRFERTGLFLRHPGRDDPDCSRREWVRVLHRTPKTVSKTARRSRRRGGCR